MRDWRCVRRRRISPASVICSATWSVDATAPALSEATPLMRISSSGATPFSPSGGETAVRSRSR